MRIAVVFHFHDEQNPVAVTEVEGAVTDMVLPEVGDTLSHRDLDGRQFQAQVIGRHFEYSFDQGEDVDGSISIMLSMKRLPEPHIH